jgi:hypothetical protein
VKLDDDLSDYKPIKSRVPRGTVFGPFLYLIYTDDIPQTNDTLIATLADDTAILTSDQDPRSASEKLQKHLDTINRWLHKWKISVNSTKLV